MERRADQFKVGLALSIILTIAAVAAGYYTREFIQSWLHITLPIYGLFVPIIVLVNVYLGRWFGILSAVFSTLVIEYWMLQQSLLPHQLSASDIATLGLYFLNCLIFIFIVDRSQRKQARVYQLEALQAQREISNKLEAALSSMTDAVFISDEKGAYVDCNEAFATFHKFNGKQEGPKTRAELLALLDIYEPSGELVAHEQLPTQRALAGETANNVELKLRRRDTGEEWIGSYNFAPIRNEAGEITGSVLVAHDITEQKQVAEKLAESEEYYRLAFQCSQNALTLSQLKDGRILEVNQRFCEIYGYTRDEAIGQTALELQLWPDKEIREGLLKEFLNQEPGTILEVEVNKKGGIPFPASMTITPIDYRGIECILVAVQDLTKDKRSAELIKTLGTLANYDSLTGLANRRLFLDRLEHCMLRNERTNEIDGLVYLDLNDFKALNDQHGHITGDFVLCEYAQRLKKAVRKGDTVARIGGDEFVILLENLGTGMEQAIATMVQIESKLRRISDEPIQLTNVEWICASSIGMKLFTSGECSAEQLLEDADRDMYKKKMEARQMVEWSEKIVA